MCSAGDSHFACARLISTVLHPAVHAGRHAWLRVHPWIIHSSGGLHTGRGERRGEQLRVHVLVHLLLHRLLLLRHLLVVAVLFVLHQHVNLVGVVLHDLDHVGHRVLHEALHPRNLEHLVGLEQVVAVVQHRGEALLVLLLDEELQQLTGDVLVAGHGGGFHGILEEAILLGQLHGFGPLMVLLVEEAGDAAELEELVLLALVRERHLVKVVVGVDGGAERVEVLLLEAQLVHGVVDGD
mmetsp:Transcript_8105/g.36879  ORF Transcript_8105/g.36879 Transcript_8105/m.36879 type:complete len:239 (+) Transcript_8105:66-782(+)